MLKIGDFSKLSMISIRMLRYFDEKELLKPYRIDLDSGYRYYLESQLVDACNIKYLQSMGFSIVKIKEILNEENSKKLNDLLYNQKSIIEEEYKKTLNQINLLEISLSKIKKENDFMKYNVVEKEFKSINVISLRKIIEKYEDEGTLWNELMEYIEKNKVVLADPCYSLAIFHDSEYREKDVDVEIQIAVEGDYENCNGIVSKTTDNINIASITFKGDYSQIDLVNQSIANYIANNKYRLNRPMFNIYHVSPGMDTNPENWITESCFPISKN